MISVFECRRSHSRLVRKKKQATARKERREGRACLAVSIAIEILKEDLQTSMIQNGDRAGSHPRRHLQCCRSPFRYMYPFLGRVDLSLL